MQVKPPASRVAIPPPTKHRAVLGQLSDMDLRLLQVFKAVVECGGMSAAELELNIGTSTVSRHMKDLETRLGLTLCRRGRAGFALTAEGQRVQPEWLFTFLREPGANGIRPWLHPEWAYGEDVPNEKLALRMPTFAFSNMKA